MWKESETIELKEGIPVSDILETVCAFANTKGGTLYIGISDEGKAKGITIGANTLENLANDMKRDIDPAVGGVSIEVIKVDDKDIIKITVPESATKPHFFHDKAHNRVGRTNQVFTPSQLEALFMKKVLGMHGVDSKPLADATLEDIDEESLKKYAKEAGRIYHDKAHALKSLGLIKEGKFLAAAVIFFGSSPERFFPLYGVKCATMAGNEIVEMSDFRENLYASVDKVVGFILRNTPSSYKIEGTRRVELPRIPRDVLREAVVNAMIHRDYSMGSSIFIRVSRDSVSIKNPGVLPPTLSVEDLYKEHHSEPRNKLLAELAHNVKLIEHWGTGTTKIIKGMREQGLEDPVFKEDKGYFEVMLLMHEPALNKRQKTIIAQLKTKEMDISAIIAMSGSSERTIRSDLAFLERAGFVRKEKRGRKNYYHT